MSDAAVADLSLPAVEQVIKPAKAKKKKAKKSTHPPTSEMVTAAIKDLKEHNGSSLQAIKKYISNTYFIDAEKISFHIRKYIKSAVDSGALVQTKGKGASGSFKLASIGGEKRSTKTQRTGSKPSVQSEKAATPRKNVLRSRKTKKPPTTPKVPKPKKGVKSTTPPVKPLKPKAAKRTKKKAALKKK